MPKYKIVSCYRCGAEMRAATMSDTWSMRIDNKFHDVPVVAIPCSYCVACDIAVVDAAADESILRCRQKYMATHRLDTLLKRILRSIRRFWRRVEWYMFNEVVYRRRGSQ
jgi:hypothetical protein